MTPLTAWLAYRLKRVKRGLLARLTLLVPGISPWMPTPAPLVKMAYSGGPQSRTLIIFLPGIDDLAADFEKRGVIDAMRRQGITADAVAIDAHFGYYAEEVILERITDDVIVWARSSGYEEIWLAGISLGGFGAALYAAHHPATINGLLLLAPYLGSYALIKEIADAGGMGQWEPGKFDAGDFPRTLWAWFKQHLAIDNPQPKIYLGFGESDKFAQANRLLSQSLHQDQLFVIAGGHDWRTWKKIWQMFLQQWHEK